MATSAKLRGLTAVTKSFGIPQNGISISSYRISKQLFPQNWQNVGSLEFSSEFFLHSPQTTWFVSFIRDFFYLQAWNQVCRKNFCKLLLGPLLFVFFLLNICVGGHVRVHVCGCMCVWYVWLWLYVCACVFWKVVQTQRTTERSLGGSLSNQIILVSPQILWHSHGSTTPMKMDENWMPPGVQIKAG